MNLEIISSKIHSPPTNFTSIHKVLNDPRIFPHVGSFLPDKVLFKLYRISKYHYSIRTNQKLNDTYSLEKLLSRPNFGFMIKNLYVSEDKSLYHLLLFKYKEKTEVILRNKFLRDFNQNMQDYVIEVTENKALIPVLFKNYYESLHWLFSDMKLDSPFRNIAKMIQVEQLFISATASDVVLSSADIKDLLSSADIKDLIYRYIQSITAGVLNLNCRHSYSKVENDIIRDHLKIYDPKEYRSQEDRLKDRQDRRQEDLPQDRKEDRKDSKDLNFTDSLTSDTQILKIPNTSYLTGITFTSLVQLTIQQLTIRVFLSDPNGISINSTLLAANMSFYSEIYLIKTLRILKIHSIFFLSDSTEYPVREVFPEDLTELKIEFRSDALNMEFVYIEVMISKLTKLEKLVSGLAEYKNLDFAKLNHLKMLKAHTITSKVLSDSIQELVLSRLTEFPIAKNLKKFNFEFWEDKFDLNTETFPYYYLENLHIYNCRSGDQLNIKFLPESLQELRIYAHHIQISTLPKKLRLFQVHAFILLLSTDFNSELRKLELEVQNFNLTDQKCSFPDFPVSLDRIDLNIDDRSDWTIRIEKKKNIFVRGFQKLADKITGKDRKDRDLEYIEKIQEKIDKYIKEKKLLGYKIKTGSFDDGSAQIDPQLAKAYLEEKEVE